MLSEVVCSLTVLDMLLRAFVLLVRCALISCVLIIEEYIEKYRSDTTSNDPVFDFQVSD